MGLKFNKNFNIKNVKTGFGFILKNKIKQHTPVSKISHKNITFLKQLGYKIK